MILLSVCNWPQRSRQDAHEFNIEPAQMKKRPGVATRPEVFGEDAPKGINNIAPHHLLRKCKNSPW